MRIRRRMPIFKTRRRKTNGRRFIILIVFLIAAIIVFTFIFAQRKEAARGAESDVAGMAPANTAETDENVSVTYTKGENTPSTEPDTDQSEDFLVLVNWDNPINKEPANLVYLKDVIDEQYVTLTDRTEMINLTAGQASNRMFQAAYEDGLRLRIDNAYRSIQEQTWLWANRIQSDPDYGSDPYHNPVKVMPGNRSEHSTGLAIDIFSTSYYTADSSFGETEAGKWLKNNAYRYGFILRYPKDKQNITGVVYEPWHFRYVGEEAAKEIYENSWCLEEYIEQLADQ